MYGTIARMRLLPGAEEMFRVYWEALSDNIMPGWVSTSVVHTEVTPLRAKRDELRNLAAGYALLAENARRAL